MDNTPSFSVHKGKLVHFGITGSVSAYKMAELLRAVLKAGMHASASLTEAACRFITPLTFASLGAEPVYTHMFPHNTANGVFPHLEPGQNAHAFLIAPASADTMARLAHGRADEILSCQALAFDGPLLIAPAMNQRMWGNPATQDNVEILRSRGHTIITPDTGLMACGEEGQGRLAPLETIYLHLLKALTPQDMEGKRLMLTLGPTQEDWDEVRFFSNSSSGLMGSALAIAAWLRGAEVEAVSGPLSRHYFPVQQLPTFPAAPITLLEGLTFHPVRSASQMLDTAQSLWPKADYGIFSAAVADFRPEHHGPGKFKKHLAPEGFTLRFFPNPDVLRLLASEKTEKQKVVGFAAESPNSEEALGHVVRKKLLAKGADMLVGNSVADGFAGTTNRVFIADIHGREEHIPLKSKPDVAWDILTWLLSL